MRNDTKKINFGSGPAALPQVVLQEASEAIFNYKNSDLSILEIPHRGHLFDAILDESKALVKELCGLGNDYEVLWLHGGGRLQFCMIPMNFLGANEEAGYLETGFWAANAAEYANYYGKANIVASSKDVNYTSLPEWPKHIPAHLSYLHITTNNTIYGTQWKEIPDVGVPLIGDMSSDIFSVSRDFNKFSMFYAVAQKNIGPAGVTLAVIRKDMLKQIKRELPPMLSFAEHAKKESILNTPPIFAIYTSLLTLRWMKNKGLDAIEKENINKAELLYGEIERNSLFHTAINPAHRSVTNVCFSCKDANHENQFLEFCEEHGVTGIAAHRSTPGFRASLYNAITIEDVDYLVQLMKEFEKKHSA
jgi:phosphoserine aminotransferase